MSAQPVRAIPRVDTLTRDRPALDGSDGTHERAFRFLMAFHNWSRDAVLF